MYADSFYYISKICFNLSNFRFFFVYNYILMIINSILSLAFLWSWKKCHQQLKDLQSLRRQIATSTIVSVTDAVSKLKATPKGKKIFMVVKGRNLSK